uniref:GATA-type domain-containing protein n=1 Tax=Araucaria cunninghamii TaxID=56994 RepID=A0A0D6R3U7_ARACU
MLQGPAAYFSPPVYGHSHYKKFWLKKMETEDDPAGSASGAPTSIDGGGVLLRNKSSYAVNYSPLELKGTSAPSAAVRAAATVKAVEDKVKCLQKSDLDYALALGVGVSMDEDVNTTESWDGFSSAEEKFDKFAAPAYNSVAAAHEEAQVANTVSFGSSNNGNSPRVVTRVCADCKTVKTPLWRNGPQGPKSLCNACGIRYKKLGKRPSSNGERPSSPSTPPISPAGKQITKLNGKRKREAATTHGGKGRQAQEDHHHHHRKKVKMLGGLERFGSARFSIGPSSLHSSSSSPSRSESESDSPGFRNGDYYDGEEGNRSREALRRWRQVERIRKGLLRYGKLRSMAKDEEEGAVLLMALSCGVAFC